MLKKLTFVLPKKHIVVRKPKIIGKMSGMGRFILVMEQAQLGGHVFSFDPMFNMRYINKFQIQMAAMSF